MKNQFDNYKKLRTEIAKETLVESPNQTPLKTEIEKIDEEKYFSRQIYFGDEIQLTRNRLINNQNNKVRTQKYSLLTWAPKSLLYQFLKISNVYFLIITILTFCPLSPKVRMNL